MKNNPHFEGKALIIPFNYRGLGSFGPGLGASLKNYDL